MTPNEMTRYRENTEKLAAMYGFTFKCRGCNRTSKPAGRKKPKSGEGWLCKTCAECR